MTDQEIMNRLQIRLSNYEKALASLLELDTKIDYSDLEKAGFLQRFEYTFELSWKLLKSALEYQGVITKSPRESIKEGLQAGLINNGDLWVEIQESRNILSHTYDQEKSLEVFNYLSKYLDVFKKLLENVKKI